MDQPSVMKASDAQARGGALWFRDLPGASPAGPAVLVPITDRQFLRDTLARLAPAELSSWIERLAQAGVVADRWESPDLLGQLRQAEKKKPRFVICGAIDLDPALPFMRTLAGERAMDIAAGAAALGKLVGAERVILAVPEDMLPAGIAALRAAAEAASVRLFPLPEEYPLAHPSLLLAACVTGRRVRAGRLPTEAGVLMVDAAAAFAAGRFFVHNEPMRRVPLGVYDNASARAHLVWAPAGITLGEVAAALGIADNATQFWAGHVLRDVAIARDAALGTSELTVFASAPHAPEPASACLRCGWCVEACPVRIHPAGLLDAAQLQDPDLAQTNGLDSCIECGICSYVCPSRLPLLASIRGMRK